MGLSGRILSVIYFVGVLILGTSIGNHLNSGPLGFMVIGVGFILYSLFVSLTKIDDD